MRTLRRLLLVPLLLVALIAGFLILTPAQDAQAAVQCYPYQAFYLGHFKTGTEANGYEAERLYRTLPYTKKQCDFDPRGKDTPVSTRKLYNRFLKVGGYVQTADAAYRAGNMVKYVRYQRAAKLLLALDISAYGLPTARLANGRFNTQTVRDLDGVIKQVTGEHLSLARVSHVYKVLLYCDAYYAYASKISALPTQVAQLWNDLNGLYGVFEKSGQIITDADGAKAVTGLALDKAGVEIPDLFIVYRKALEFGSKVAKQMSYKVVAETYVKRIGYAVQDSVWADPNSTGATGLPVGWGITTNSVGPLTPGMTPAQITAITHADYSAYINRYAINRALPPGPRGCDSAYTRLIPGNPQVMVRFDALHEPSNFSRGLKYQLPDYRLQVLDAIQILASGNPSQDAKLPRTDRNVGIGSTRADIEAAYNDPNRPYVTVDEDYKALGVTNGDTVLSWYWDGQHQGVLNLGNKISFRLHNDHVVGIQVAANYGRYEDTPSYCAMINRQLVK